jgi:tetratricopeptide (TPR) repeat protein
LDYERSGDQAQLEAALRTMRSAVAACPPKDPDRHVYVGHLGGLLQILYTRTGDPADIDEAIVLLDEAYRISPVNHQYRPGYLSNLVNAFCSRYNQERQPADLNQAIEIGRHAVAAAPLDDGDRPMFLSNLAVALQMRYELTGEPDDMDKAIDNALEAVDTARVSDRYAHSYLANLSAMLLTRFEETGQSAYLDDAIALGRESLEHTPADHPDRPRYLIILAAALRARFESTGVRADLDDDITHIEEAVAATPRDHPNRTAYLFNLGSALLARHELTSGAGSIKDALTAFQAASDVATAPPTERLLAAREGGRAAMDSGDADTALRAYTTAIELLPLVSWHGLDRATQENHLRTWIGLPAEAAAAAIAAGQPARAVELIEAGRSVLWIQALNLRHDLAELQEHAPDLAAVLAKSRAVLAEPALPSNAGYAMDRGTTELNLLERRRQAALDWDIAISQIRKLDNFKNFLAPVPFDDLQEAAVDGPVVIVSIGADGSHALVISHDKAAVQVVELPEAGVEQLLEQVEVLLGAQERAGDPSERDRLAVFDVLAWAWRAIAEPVLVHLGCEPAVEVRQRVWWCPTGPAVLLPLHAAGNHPRTPRQSASMGELAAVAETVAGRVISSYTPTLTDLIRARARRPLAHAHKLIVGVPGPLAYAPMVPTLPGVAAELQVLAEHNLELTTQLVGKAATHRAVMNALPGHSWLHLSCHGVQNEADPNLSAFLLHDQRLTLDDLAALNLPEADFAYLAACETATAYLELVDESLHLAAGLMVVGFRHVIASLWSISDAAAPAMAEIIYGHLASAAHPVSDSAAHALHEAVTLLRQKSPGDPLVWAPYIHLGP